MPSRREQIQMSDDELRAFLDEQMVMQCATVGPQGLPHMVPLWFVAEEGTLIGLDLREVAEGTKPRA